MNYATITLYCLVCGLCLFIILDLYRRIRRDISIDKPVENIISIPETKPVKPVKKVIAGNVRKVYNVPRSMTSTEKYLYSIKPNLQYWINLWGVGILNKSVSELKGEKLFENDKDLKLTVIKHKYSPGFVGYFYNWKNERFVKRLYERGRVQN